MWKKKLDLNTLWKNIYDASRYIAYFFRKHKTLCDFHLLVK